MKPWMSGHIAATRSRFQAAVATCYAMATAVQFLWIVCSSSWKPRKAINQLPDGWTWERFQALAALP